MNILITNDDGIFAPGLSALCDQLKKKHNITVVAPDRERSAIAHGITLHDPLRVKRIELDSGICGYAVSGTPADCVKLALAELMIDRLPDIVISGINKGNNLGVNITYSGTVAAAREATMSNILAISVSLVQGLSYDYVNCAKFIDNLAQWMIRQPIPKGTFFNVNFPNCPVDKIAGVKLTYQNTIHINEQILRLYNSGATSYYWYGEDRQSFDTQPESDGGVLKKNYISVTPVKCDTTDYDTLKTLSSNVDFVNIV